MYEYSSGEDLPAILLYYQYYRHSNYVYVFRVRINNNADKDWLGLANKRIGSNVCGVCLTNDLLIVSKSSCEELRK